MALGLCNLKSHILCIYDQNGFRLIWNFYWPLAIIKNIDSTNTRTRNIQFQSDSSLTKCNKMFGTAFYRIAQVTNAIAGKSKSDKYKSILASETLLLIHN